MSDRFQELALFVRVAETASFSRAARETGIAQPTVSRVIGALETRLEVKLLMRTTRKVVLTEAGAALLGHARIVLAQLEDAEKAARGSDGLTGVLRIATPVTFGAREIAPRLKAFLDAHPALRIELLMSDRRVDLLEEGVDLAIRLGPLEDSAFVTRTLASAPRYLVASPAYVQARAEPLCPENLSEHDIIADKAPGAVMWTLSGPQRSETRMKLDARIVATSVEGVLSAAVAGLGIAATSLFACRAELQRAELVRILRDFSLPPINVHAVFPGGRRPSAKARAFTDHLAAVMAVRP